MIELTQTEVTTFLDLGCGDGVLGLAIAQQYPQAQGVFLDMSESMLTAAQDNCNRHNYQADFVLADFGIPNWLKAITKFAPFEVIVSGFSIHHQPDARKQEIYREIYDLLQPGGIFLNLEHTASRSQLGEKAFDELFVDALYDYHHRQGNNQSKAAIAEQYYSREDKNANILALVEIQCNWLREIGFIDVDCYFKILEIALFGGVKPSLSIYG